MEKIGKVLAGRARSILSANTQGVGYTEMTILDVLQKEGYETAEIIYLSTKNRKLTLREQNRFLASELRLYCDAIKKKINRRAGKIIISEKSKIYRLTFFCFY